MRDELIANMLAKHTQRWLLMEAFDQNRALSIALKMNFRIAINMNVQ